MRTPCPAGGHADISDDGSWTLRAITVALLAAGVVGCESDGPVRDGEWPGHLSGLQVLHISTDSLSPVDGFAYDLGHPLFSDYAWKYRTVSLPDGVTAHAARDDQTLDFPIGTVITKTFAYPLGAGGTVRTIAAPTLAAPNSVFDRTQVRLIETRVLRHEPEGWAAVSYRWDESGRDASLATAGALVPLTTEAGEAFPYLIPDRNQCAGCHETAMGSRTLHPIGPKPGNLAVIDFAGGDNQYAVWRTSGWVDGAEPSTWPPRDSVGADTAHAYLDANCAHCHSDTGAADTTGLDLRITATDAARGVCKTPVAAGRGSGGFAHDIEPGHPEKSILVFRVNHRDPGIMMPELGRSLTHREGVELLSRWIGELAGTCFPATEL
ncbi:MAG: hypothetical protein ACO3Z6_03710 [Pseudomonadales bacterium]